MTEKKDQTPQKPPITPSTDMKKTVKLPKIIQFDELARCGEEIWIENEGELYRLRKTKQGKLLLTK